MATREIGVALIGCGGIALANHVPGLRYCPEVKLVALCDADAGVLERAGRETGVTRLYTDHREILEEAAVDAVIIATPNHVHAAAACAAAEAGKHILCEKPLALTLPEAQGMLRAVEKAGVKHMTAFTYRFVPAMRYMAHLVRTGFLGEPYHFRSCREQDWGTRYLGWRQQERYAATGELGDMLSHRIDFAHLLIGDIRELVADLRRFHEVRGGYPSELEDWVGVIARFENEATGIFESTKVASGHGEGGQSRDYCEVTGSEGTLTYHLTHPHEVMIGHAGKGDLKSQPVPAEFLTLPGSKRDPAVDDPVRGFRYDQDFEFIEAIREDRPCRPSFADGVKVQAVMEAVMQSARHKAWARVA